MLKSLFSLYRGELGNFKSMGRVENVDQNKNRVHELNLMRAQLMFLEGKYQ